MNQIKSKIKKHLQNNGFFDCLKQSPELDKKILKSFQKSFQNNYPTNLLFHNSWSEINHYPNLKNFLVIELGGTYLKLFLIDSNQKKIIIKKRYKQKFWQKIVYTPNILYANIYHHLISFLSWEQIKQIQEAVFIFTFPLKQFKRSNHTLDGICTKFEKSHKQKGIIGSKIGSGLEKYLRKKKLTKIKVSLTNDAPLSLLALKKIELSKEINFDLTLNLIVGTGTNIALAKNINYPLKLINTEWGTFDLFKPSKYDQTVNQNQQNPSLYHTERMIAGGFRHLIFIEIIQDLVHQKILSRQHLEKILKYATDPIKLDDKLKKVYTKNSPFYLLKYIWNLINIRAAGLCAIALATIINSTNNFKEKYKVGVILSGGVIDNSTIFRNTLIKIVNKLLIIHSGQTIEITYHRPEQQTTYGAVFLYSLLNKKLLKSKKM